MALKIVCPGCETVLTAPDSFAGRKIRCKNCNTSFFPKSVERVPDPPPKPPSQLARAKPTAPAVPAAPAATPRQSVRPVAPTAPAPNALFGQPTILKAPEPFGVSPSDNTGSADYAGKTILKVSEPVGVSPRPNNPGSAVFEQGTILQGPAASTAAPPRQGSSKIWLLLLLMVAVGFVMALGLGGALLAVFWPTSTTTTPPGPSNNAAVAPSTGVHGGIEIGAKGVKITAVEVIPDEQLGYDLKVLLASSNNTTLVAGLGKTGRFDPEALKDTQQAVKKFFNQLRTEFKIPVERIYIVGSSGLVSAIDKNKEQVRQNRDDLSAAIQEATGKTMDFVDVDREVELSILGSVPRKHLDEALLMDVGSGNTKGGFRDPAGTFVTFGIPYGTVTYTDLVKKRAADSGKPFAETSVLLGEEAISEPLQAQLERKPGLRQRQRVYLSGGMVWAAATCTRPADRRTFTELTPADFDTFAQLPLADPDATRAAVLAKVANDDPKLKAAVASEMTKVQDTFTPDNLRAGAVILQESAKVFRFGERKVYFARFGYVGWLLAYISEQGKPSH